LRFGGMKMVENRCTNCIQKRFEKYTDKHVSYSFVLENLV